MQHQPEKHAADGVADADSPFRRLRLERGLNMSEVARRTGLDRHTVMRLDRGETKPHAATALLLAACLGCRPAELRGGRDG